MICTLSLESINIKQNMGQMDFGECFVISSFPKTLSLLLVCFFTFIEDHVKTCSIIVFRCNLIMY